MVDVTTGDRRCYGQNRTTEHQRPSKWRFTVLLGAACVSWEEAFYDRLCIYYCKANAEWRMISFERYTSFEDLQFALSRCAASVGSTGEYVIMGYVHVALRLPFVNGGQLMSNGLASRHYHGTLRYIAPGTLLLRLLHPLRLHSLRISRITPGTSRHVKDRACVSAVLMRAADATARFSA